jgi:hypothetical protein
MFDDIRRVGEKVDDLLGTDIFPFNYPFSYTENFLSHMDNWEFAIPLRFLWLVNIEHIPSMVNSGYMHNLEPSSGEQSSGSIDSPGTRVDGWDINQGKREITKDTYMKTGGGKHGCLLCQGAVLPGENYDVSELPIDNNMGFIPGKIGGNRPGAQALTLQWRETNRSFPDLVLRPWLMLASHMGLVARPPRDDRNIKTNISIVQLAKTYQHIPLVERKIWRFYNCVPTSIDSKEITHEEGGNFSGQIYTTSWAYTHYSIESLPRQDMGAYMSNQGFKKFVKDMAHKLLSKNRTYKKIRKKLARVEEFVDKAIKIKKKVMKVLDFFGGSKGPAPGSGPSAKSVRQHGRSAGGKFLSNKGEFKPRAGDPDWVNPRKPDRDVTAPLSANQQKAAKHRAKYEKKEEDRKRIKKKREDIREEQLRTGGTSTDPETNDPITAAYMQNDQAKLDRRTGHNAANRKRIMNDDNYPDYSQGSGSL